MIKVANAPCSWGVLEFDLQGEAAKYPQVLDEIAETGYAGTELGDWGFMPTDPVKLNEELCRRNLKLLGAFVPVNFSFSQSHDKGEEIALKTASLLSSAAGKEPFIILADENGSNEFRTKNAGRIKSNDGLTEQSWDTFANGLNRIAEAVKENYGLRTVFHHHCAGFVETPEEIDMLMSKTDPKLVGLCLDTGHYKFGGGDPVEALEKYSGRIWHVHFKDCNSETALCSRENKWDYFESVKNGVFCELGKGSVDFASIKSLLDKVAYDGWIVVEQDVLPGMGNPKECASRNRNFIKSLGL